MNPKPLALPIIIFGGSPIKVAVPPILEAKTSVNKKGMGLISRVRVMESVTGTTNSTVVTLSKKC